MPGWGSNLSGSSAQRIVFGSYGTGQATLSRGIWFINDSYLTFDDLAVGTQQGFGGGHPDSFANNITIQRCTIALAPGNSSVGVVAYGSHWTIADNTVENTGDSGLLLTGDGYSISGNTIANTGVDPAITYGAHGIYLKASNAQVIGNTITNFQNDGISVRYRNSVVSGNTITDGEIGIAWFQYDPAAGTSQWTGNRITGLTVAGIYVSPSDIAGNTRESFVITGNQIAKPTGASAAAEMAAGWEAMNLHPTTGVYTVADNPVS
jgi:hypothetical protein